LPYRDKFLKAVPQVQQQRFRELNMKDILCVATFASKLLCLVAFVFMLKPHGISPVEATTKPQACELTRVHPLRMQKSC
jgi:hypothetical protein